MGILSAITFLPLVGAFLILLIRDEGANARRNIRAIALWTTIGTFLVSLSVWAGGTWTISISSSFCFSSSMRR